MSRSPMVFISYSSNDRTFARQLADDLVATHVQVWIDERHVEVGDEISDVLTAAVLDADFVIVVLSSNAIRSPWVQREINATLEQELRRNRTILLPVLIDNNEIPSVLANRVFCDFRSDYGSALGKLLKAIKNTRRGVKSKSRVEPSRRRSFGIIDVESINYFIDKLRDNNIQSRLSAVSVLRTALPHTVAGLTLVLDDIESQVRREAASALAVCAPESFEGLMKASHDNDTEVRIIAVRALGGCRSRAIVRCVEILESEDDDTVKIAAVQSLRAIGSDSVPALISVIRSQKYTRWDESRVYHAAAEALGMLAGESDDALTALVEEVEHPAGLAHVFAAMRALGGLGPRAQPAITGLVTLSKDDDVDIRIVAKEALIKIVGDDRYGKSDWSA